MLIGMLLIALCAAIYWMRSYDKQMIAKKHPVAHEDRGPAGKSNVDAPAHTQGDVAPPTPILEESEGTIPIPKPTLSQLIAKAQGRPIPQPAPKPYFPPKIELPPMPQWQIQQVGSGDIASAHHWDAPGFFDYPVAGTSHYREALKTMAGHHGDDDARRQCTAILMPENANPHDNEAIAVYIGGEIIGHMHAEDAHELRCKLTDAGLDDQNTSCDALIIGGGLKDGRRKFHGVRLDLNLYED